MTNWSNDDEACRRLMDMLAGWAAYIDPEQEDHEIAGNAKECELVNDLYQAAGNLTTAWDVEQFVLNQLMNVILDGRKS